MLAGMFECDADVVVTIDADLQDDERCIETKRRPRYLVDVDTKQTPRSDD